METHNEFFGIDDYMARFTPYIKRYEARLLAQRYVVGLMMDGDRKSAEPMSEEGPRLGKGDAEIAGRGQVGP